MQGHQIIFKRIIFVSEALKPDQKDFETFSRSFVSKLFHHPNESRTKLFVEKSNILLGRQIILLQFSA